MPVGWNEKQCAELLSLRAEKKTFVEIGNHFGISRVAACVKWQRLMHPERHGRTRWSAEENAELEKQRDKGVSFEAIADSLGRTPFGCKIQYHALKRGKARSTDWTRQEAAKKTVRETMIERAEEVRFQPLRYATPFSEMLGEPAIGRSALDQKKQGLIQATSAVSAIGRDHPDSEGAETWR